MMSGGKLCRSFYKFKHFIHLRAEMNSARQAFRQKMFLGQTLFGFGVVTKHGNGLTMVWLCNRSQLIGNLLLVFRCIYVACPTKQLVAWRVRGTCAVAVEASPQSDDGRARIAYRTAEAFLKLNQVLINMCLATRLECGL